MAEHSGIFDWFKKKNGTGPIELRSFFSYFSSDGSPIPVSALPDANSLVTVNMLNNAISDVIVEPVFRIPFTAQTGIVINWQTDMPDGVNTYQSLYGNNVEAFVYFTLTPGGQPYSWTLDGSFNVLVVTFDWGVAQSGYIRF